ncbi:GNAT family N-acetyltransferase [Anianabacter salinae]|uniref:GNAT family N-acetyltransferase n=1 Tax=Anianabacter salinae TaxID=2851023 RepID=UPI00225DE195|nr:GNAT family N-acetyltransferase [Anianabacter salinae]MBV0913922.1 GNAT family N-acetyltransferase [Anianabacter salinae]
MIRAARAGDAGSIASIWNPFIRDSLVTFNSAEKSEEEIVSLLSVKADLGHGFFVAEADGAIVGFATYGQFRAGIGYAHTFEHSILIGPQGRGRGVGRALMDAVERHAAAAGGHSIFAGVSSGNPSGRAFHAAVGFKDVATLPEVGWKFGQWLDLHLMQKRLVADIAGETR